MKWNENVYRIFDILRFPLVVLVVFLHCKGEPGRLHIDWLHLGLVDGYDFLRNYISNVVSCVSVPTFFLMSGYLFYHHVDNLTYSLFKDKIKRRLKSLAVPYIFWILLFLVGNLFFVFRNTESCNLWQSFCEYFAEHGHWHILWDCNLMEVKTPAIGFVQDNSAPLLVPMWFVRDLMVVALCSPMLWWCIRKIDVLFIVVLGICYLFQLWPYMHGVSSVSFFFFSIGIFMCKHAQKMDAFLKNTGWLIMFFSVLLSLLLVYLTDTQNVCQQFVLRGYAIMVCISSLFIGYLCVEMKGTYLLQRLSKASFVVYAAHMVFVSKYVGVGLHCLMPANSVSLLTLKYLLVPVFTIAICLLVYFAFRKFCPKMMMLLNGGR